VVDDEPLIVETAGTTLEAAGYRVISAANGNAAVATYRRAPEAVNLVLLDMTMPGLDGLATMESLRAINPDLRIIATSGFRRPDEEGGRLSAADGFLPKPYTDDRLLRLVRQVLDQKARAESK